MTGAFRCADDAESRDEALAGTASRARRFVLIEYPTPWPHRALEAISDDLRGTLVEAAEAAFAKVLLIRRPGAKTLDARRWAVYDAQARRSLWGEWSAETDLQALIQAIGSDPSENWSADPTVLVCTHARHDACCGVRGRPIAAALAEARPDLVWECTHVGGHRFAGNLVLPLDGTYYGHVSLDDALDVVETHMEKSEVSARHLRGFSWMSPAAQAVAAEVHRRWGPAGADDIEAATAEALGPDRWRVELTAGGVLPSAVTAEVERVVGPDARMSCKADPMPTEAFVIRTLDAGSQ